MAKKNSLDKIMEISGTPEGYTIGKCEKHGTFLTRNDIEDKRCPYSECRMEEGDRG